MVRAPCCEKTGLKKGPWSTEEDKILTNFIHLHGHGNWRALPKKAGLLRCGKSCRLRWTNYLRLDIKRGNFSNEEEETIIKLHGELGNRWSAIAAQLPGRTDNEIKNVWHTNLKKILVKIDQGNNETKKETSKNSSCDFNDKKDEEASMKSPNQSISESLDCMPTSQSSSEMPTMSYESNDLNNKIINEDYENNGISNIAIKKNNACLKEDSSIGFVDMDEDFWSEILSSTESSDITADEFLRSSIDSIQEKFTSLPLSIMEFAQDNDFQREDIQEQFPSSPLSIMESIQEYENQREVIDNIQEKFNYLYLLWNLSKTMIFKGTVFKNNFHHHLCL